MAEDAMHKNSCIQDQWVTAKRTGTQVQQGHTRPCPNPYSDPKLNPIHKP